MTPAFAGNFWIPAFAGMTVGGGSDGGGGGMAVMDEWRSWDGGCGFPLSRE